MNKNSRFEWKVGLFVFVGLTLLALLMLNFSKGLTLFQPAYDLKLTMASVAGLKPKADVMMAGVPIGKVVDTQLSPDGRSVIIRLRILQKYKIFHDAHFRIESLGFLGDQYVEIMPTKNEDGVWKDGDIVTGEEPFNLQEAVRSTSSLLDQAKKTMAGLDQSITNLNRSLLSQETLTNFGLAISNLSSVTESAVKMAQEVEGLLHTNTPPINAAVTNLHLFSQKLNTMADQLGETISSNRNDVTEAVKNFRDTSANLKQLSADLQGGKGVAGTLLKDEHLKMEMSSVVSNANALSANLSLFTSNLNQQGLWRMLWKPKTPPPTPLAKPGSSSVKKQSR